MRLLSFLVLALFAGPAASFAASGVVIESVDSGSLAEDLGLAAGDVLVSWCRTGEGPDCVAAGTFASPFDYVAVEGEQVLRGGVRLEVLRGELPIRVEMPKSPLRLPTRPAFSEEQLSAYREALADEAGKAPGRLAAWAEGPEVEPGLAVWWLARAAQLSEKSRNWPETDGYYRAAIERATAAGEVEAAVQLLRDWGQLLTRRAAFDEADERFVRSLELDRSRGGESLSVARTLSSMAIAASQRRDLDRAEILLREAAPLVARLAPDSSFQAGILVNEANLALFRADLAAADRLLGRALAIEEQIGPASRNFAAALYTSARVAAARGDLSKAEALLRKELPIVERLRPGSFEQGAALDLLAQVLMRQGDIDSAEILVRKALAVKEKIDLSGASQAVSINNLSHLARARGDFAEAERLLERSMALKQKASPDPRAVVSELNNLAALAGERGDLARSEELYRRVITIQGETDGSLSTGLALSGLSSVAAAREQHEIAEGYLRRALDILERVAPATIAKQLYDLAEAVKAQGRQAEAAPLYCRAADAADAELSKMGGTDVNRSGLRSSKSLFFDGCLRAQVEQGELDRAFATLERDRARVFLETLAERDLLVAEELPPRLARRRRELAAEHDATLAALGGLDAGKDSLRIEELNARLHAIQAEQAVLAGQIRAESPRFGSLKYPQPLDLAGARAALDPGTVLLAYAVGEDKTHAFLVQPADEPGEGLFVRVLPAGRTQLAEAVARYRNLLVDPTASRDALLAEGSRLYELLVEPFAPQIDRSRRLLLSAHGSLLTLPFAALVREGRYLVEWKPLHHVASATVYAQLARTRSKTPKAGGRLVVFGDPAYPGGLDAKRETAGTENREVLSAVARGLSLEPLPATRKEALEIAGLFPGSERYLGPEATEERAKALPRDVAYLHFACHGILDEINPLGSALALTIREDPEAGEDNGLLQAWEIMESVRLDAELVTLSACDTALGKELGGEGLVGLTRAFQYAGARSVLASLWGISDGSTAELMSLFYSHLRNGKTKDEALRLAQTGLLRRGGRLAHPASWAAFQLAGDWK